MNTQEFAEWLQEQHDLFAREANEARGVDPYKNGFMRGCSIAYHEVLDKLTALDSSHDLPSTKGR